MSPRDRRIAARPADGQPQAEVDAFRAQHLALACRDIQTATGHTTVIVDDAESPLAWLARRKGRGGSALINAVQLEAGERLRADFTRAQMTPRTTSNWSAAVASGRRSIGGGAAAMTDMVVAAQQRVRHALDAVGPEFAGLLLDVCCFLKGLEDVERERRWPARSAKVVLQLGLDSLARHYGYGQELTGAAKQQIRAWNADVGALAAASE